MPFFKALLFCAIAKSVGKKLRIMGKQAMTFVKAQTLAMHYIKCCELVALFTILAHRLGNLFTTLTYMKRCA